MRGASCLGQACATWASSPWYLQGKGHCMVIIPACRNLDLAPASAAFPRSALGCCLCGVCGGISAWPVPSLGGHCSLVCAAVGANCWWGNSLVRSITDTSPLTGVIELSPPRPKVLYRKGQHCSLCWGNWGTERCWYWCPSQTGYVSVVEVKNSTQSWSSMIHY